RPAMKPMMMIQMMFHTTISHDYEIDHSILIRRRGRKEGEKGEHQRFSDAARNSRADYIVGTCHCLPPTGYGCDFPLITPGGPLVRCRPKAPRPSPQLQRLCSRCSDR